MLVQAGSTSPIGWQIDQIDASVAPPRLISRGAGAAPRGSGPAGHRDPVAAEQDQPQRSRWPRRRRPGVDAASRISAGTEFHTVTPCRRPGRTSAPGRAASSASGSTTRAAAREQAEHVVDGQVEAAARTAPARGRPAPTPKRALTSTTVLSAPRWSIITPLGTPVDPEVKMTYARSCRRVGRSAAAPAGRPPDSSRRRSTATLAGQSSSASPAAWVRHRADLARAPAAARSRSVGQLGVDRQVGRARRRARRARRRPAPSPSPSPRRPVRPGAPQPASAVGERPRRRASSPSVSDGRRDHRRALRNPGGRGEERLVQQPCRRGPPVALYVTRARQLRGGAGDGTGSGQCALVGREPPQHCPRAPRASSSSIPAGNSPSTRPMSMHQRVVEFVHLVVEPDLRRLGDAVNDLTDLRMPTAPWKRLVKTTGITAAASPRTRFSSRVTRTPLNIPWSRSERSRSRTARARASKGTTPVASISRSVTEVKSPRISSTCGCSGNRLTIGRLRVNRRLFDHAASTSAYAASRRAVGVRPRRARQP